MAHPAPSTGSPPRRLPGRVLGRIRAIRPGRRNRRAPERPEIVLASDAERPNMQDVVERPSGWVRVQPARDGGGWRTRRYARAAGTADTPAEPPAPEQVFALHDAVVEADRAFKAAPLSGDARQALAAALDAESAALR
ncbi:MAG: hypothetical protein K6T92_06310, partial [Candidatus Rokubacteria bacterium]|nr:hypothetical protein [Candidatus Rokubacteria bacterium]